MKELRTFKRTKKKNGSKERNGSWEKERHDGEWVSVTIHRDIFFIYFKTRSSKIEINKYTTEA